MTGFCVLPIMTVSVEGCVGAANWVETVRPDGPTDFPGLSAALVSGLRVSVVLLVQVSGVLAALG